jgi:hypothetical protein
MPYVRDPTVSDYAAIALFLVFECFYILHIMGLMPATTRLLQFAIVHAATTASTETSNTTTAIEKPAPIFQPAITHAATTAGRPFSNPPYIWERCPGYDPQRPRPRDLYNDFTDEERAAAVRWGEERLQKSLLKRKIADAATTAAQKTVRFNPVWKRRHSARVLTTVSLFRLRGQLSLQSRFSSRATTVTQAQHRRKTSHRRAARHSEVLGYETAFCI